MGKYVLIEFESDDQADALISKISRAHEAGQKTGRGFRVAGIFQRPPVTKLCECTFASQTESVRFRRRHRKTGFVYCARCKRVRKGSQAPLNQLIDPERLKDPRFIAARDSGMAHLTLQNDDGRPLANFPITVMQTKPLD